MILRAFIRVIVMAMALLLGGCSPGAGRKVRASFSAGVPVVLWVDWAGSAGLFRDRAAALDTCRLLRASGISHLALEARDRNGREMMAEYGNVRAAAQQSGLGLAFVVPLFLADETTPEDLLEQSAAWTGDAWEVRPAQSASGFPRRLSPAIESVRRREIDLIGRLSDDPATQFIILSGCGFSGRQSDLGGQARGVFESWSGLSIRNWPAEVLGGSPAGELAGPANRGPYWNAWTTWRAATMRDFLIQARGRISSSIAQPPPRIVVLTEGPYLVHQASGLNWAVPDAPIEADLKWLPSGYSSTGVGHLIDTIALGTWQPALTRPEQAADAGFPWWMSMAGSAATARRYTSTESSLWAAIPVDDPGQTRQFTDAATGVFDGLLFISSSSLLRNGQAQRQAEP